MCGRLSLYLVGLAVEEALAVPWKPFDNSGTIVKTFENQTVTFPCAAGESGETVQWSKNNNLIADSRDETLSNAPPNIRLLKDNSIQISNVTSADSGNYTCRIVGSGHKLMLIHNELEVQYPATVSITPSDGKVRVKINSEVELTCSTSGVPKPSITWMFEGQEMKLLTPRETLRFQAADPAMAGEYKCIAMNTASAEPAIGKFTVEIEYKPVVRTASRWIHSAIGVKQDIECEITGYPKPKIQWLFNGTEIKFNNLISYRTSGNKSRIHLGRVSEKDFGFFTCQASNILGESKEVIQVSGAPNVAALKKPSYYDPAKRAFNLTWQVYSETPLIDYELRFRKHIAKGKKPDWIKKKLPAPNSRSIIYEDHYDLIIEPGVYEAQILSRNMHGWSKPSIIVILSATGEDESTTNDMTGTLPESSLATDGYTTSFYESSSTSSCSSIFLSVTVLLSSALFCKIM